MSTSNKKSDKKLLPVFNYKDSLKKIAEGSGSLESPLTLLDVAMESTVKIQEVLYRNLGTGYRENEVKIEVVFPAEENDEDPRVFFAREVFFKIESDTGAMVQFNMPYKKVVELGEKLNIELPSNRIYEV